MASYNNFFLPQEQAEGLSRYMVSLNVMVPHEILLWKEICAMDFKLKKKYLSVMHEDC